MAFARRAIAAFWLSVLLASNAGAQINLGAVLSLTGPAASLGIPERNTIAVQSRRRRRRTC